MAEEQLREIVDAMRDRIHAELDAQSQALTARYESVVADARREAAAAAEAEAEKRWAARVEAIRVEWGARLQSEVAAARADAEKRLVAESMRARVEAEQAAAEAAARARDDLERALASERQRAEAAMQDERRRADEHLHHTLAAMEAERQQLERLETGRPPSDGPDAKVVLDGVRTLEEARTLSEILAAVVRASSAAGPRVALFVVNGSHLDEWSVAGVQPQSSGGLDLESADAGLLTAAVRTGAAAFAVDRDSQRNVPAFARSSSPARATAVPLMLGGQAVAVLYADDGNHGGGMTSPAWLSAVELLGRHAAACLAHLTAVRALQLAQTAAPRQEQHEAAGPDDDQSARRYAKLLVSEIKLYNENAVRAGREKRDLMQRLNGEIERARRLYEERVSASVKGREAYFHEELVRTLAGGDPAVLGR